MPTANNMDISATSDVTDAVTSTAYVENTTKKHDTFCCSSNCSTLHCSFNSGNECPFQSDSSFQLLDSEHFQSDSAYSSVHHGTLTVTAPYSWNSMNSHHVTTYASSVSCSESTRSSTDDVCYSYPVSITTEDDDCCSVMNGICIFVKLYFILNYSY